MVPIYIQLADIITARIESGTIARGRPIPSLNQMQQEFGVARGTITHAVQVLVDRGLVAPVTGKGTYVLPEASSGENTQT